MVEYSWPLKKKLPEGHQPFVASELIEFLSEVDPDTPVWILNYRQIRRDTTQRPVDGMGVGDDAFHIC